MNNIDNRSDISFTNNSTNNSTNNNKKYKYKYINIDNNTSSHTPTQVDNNVYISSSTSTSYEEHNTITEIDEEWYSGSGIGGNDGTGTITNIFQFSKKMDWTKVKSITINNTVIPMQ